MPHGLVARELEVLHVVLHHLALPVDRVVGDLLHLVDLPVRGAEEVLSQTLDLGARKTAKPPAVFSLEALQNTSAF